MFGFGRKKKDDYDDSIFKSAEERGSLPSGSTDLSPSVRKRKARFSKKVHTIKGPKSNRVVSGGVFKAFGVKKR